MQSHVPHWPSQAPILHNIKKKLNKAYESWVCAVATAVPNGMVYRYEVETIETYISN